MNCYSLANIFNDFQVKPSKKIIILKDGKISNKQTPSENIEKYTQK